MSTCIDQFIYLGHGYPGLPQATHDADEMARHDPYLSAHRAVRDCLHTALAALGRVDVDDASAQQSALDGVASALDLAQCIETQEERILHPVLDAVCPELTRHAAADHVASRLAADALRGDLARLHRGLPMPERRAALRTLEAGFARYCADALCHAERERAAHNPVLWQHLSDACLQHLQYRLQAEAPLSQRCTLCAWMVRSAPAAERPGLLFALRERVPAEAYDMLLDQLQPLPGTSSPTPIGAA